MEEKNEVVGVQVGAYYEIFSQCRGLVNCRVLWKVLSRSERFSDNILEGSSGSHLEMRTSLEGQGRKQGGLLGCCNREGLVVVVKLVRMVKF